MDTQFGQASAISFQSASAPKKRAGVGHLSLASLSASTASDEIRFGNTTQTPPPSTQSTATNQPAGNIAKRKKQLKMFHNVVDKLYWGSLIATLVLIIAPPTALPMLPVVIGLWLLKAFLQNRTPVGMDDYKDYIGTVAKRMKQPDSDALTHHLTEGLQKLDNPALHKNDYQQYHRLQLKDSIQTYVNYWDSVSWLMNNNFDQAKGLGGSTINLSTIRNAFYPIRKQSPVDLELFSKYIEQAPNKSLLTAEEQRAVQANGVEAVISLDSFYKVAYKMGNELLKDLVQFTESNKQRLDMNINTSP